MGYIRHYMLLLMAAISLQPLFARETLPAFSTTDKNKALIFTPLVLIDPISIKAAFEYRLNTKFNLIVPVEAQWMNYRAVLQLFNKKYPQEFYRNNAIIRPLWNIDYSHLVIAAGLGLKAFPFSEPMTSAFFLKSTLLAGVERFNAFAAEGVKHGTVITMVMTMGYNFVASNFFTFGAETGLEHSYHLNPIKNFPSIFGGFGPILQLSFGFLI